MGVSSTELTLVNKTKQQPTPQLNQAIQQEKSNLNRKIDYFKKLEKTTEKSTSPKNKQKVGKLIQGKLENPGKIEKFLLKTENKTKQQNQTIPNNENLTTQTGNNKNQQARKTNKKLEN